MIHVNDEEFYTKRGIKMKALGVIETKKIACLASDSIVIVPHYIMVDYNMKYKTLVFRETDTRPLYRHPVETENLGKRLVNKILKVKTSYSREFYTELAKLKNQIDLAISKTDNELAIENYKKILCQIMNLKF